MRRNRHSGRAFTLIEVLVSLAIFALAAVVLSVAYLNVIGSYRALDSQHRSDENWKELRLTVLTEPDRKIVEAGGRLTLPDGREMSWKATIEPTEIADLFRLGLEAEAPASNGSEAWQRKESLYALRSSWSDPAEREQLRDATRKRLAEERAK